MDNKKKCEKGYHYHPNHLKADANGCMKDDDMKKEDEKKENFIGTTNSIYNAVRNVGQRRNPKSYIGVV